MPLYTYYFSRGAAGYWIDLCSAPRGLRCLKATKDVREGDCISTYNVSHDVNARSSALDSTGERYGACVMFAYGRASRIPGPKSTGGEGSRYCVLDPWGPGMERPGLHQPCQGRSRHKIPDVASGKEMPDWDMTALSRPESSSRWEGGAWTD